MFKYPILIAERVITPDTHRAYSNINISKRTGVNKFVIITQQKQQQQQQGTSPIRIDTHTQTNT